MIDWVVVGHGLMLLILNFWQNNRGFTVVAAKQYVVAKKKDCESYLSIQPQKLSPVFVT